MRHCAIKECTNSDKNCNGFHKIPSNEELRSKWMASSQFKANKKLYVCSEHFTEADYVSSETNILKKNAVPTKKLSLPPRNEHDAEHNDEENDSEQYDNVKDTKAYQKKNKQPGPLSVKAGRLEKKNGKIEEIP